MKKTLAFAAVLSLVLFAGFASAEEAVKSGPQVGATVPGPFHPLNVTGDKAGEKFCLYCVNGTNPVAMIFAREPSKSLTSLIRKIDAETAKNSDKKMGSFVVFLNDSEDLAGKLKTMAEKQKVNKTVLSIDNQGGPKSYKIAKDADVTVVLYTDHTVKSNYAFKKGELDAKAVEKIVADLPKILN